MPAGRCEGTVWHFDVQMFEQRNAPGQAARLRGNYLTGQQSLLQPVHDAAQQLAPFFFGGVALERLSAKLLSDLQLCLNLTSTTAANRTE